MAEVTAGDEEKPGVGKILIGSMINNKDGEHFVAIYVNEGGARLSVEGARLVAKQMTEWADYAEKRNKERGDYNIVLRYVKTAVDKAQASGWVAVDPAAKPAPVEAASDQVAAKKRGGAAGGKVRAEKLTPERRKEIAKSAANKRWSAKAPRASR